MRLPFKHLLATAAIGLWAGWANADVITDTHTITASGADTIGYTYFTVSEDDVVELYTTSSAIDPVLYLLRDDGDLTPDDAIAFDDDACPTSLCGVAGGGYWNALITQPLTAGSYIVAVGDYALSLSSVVNGINTGNAAFGILTGDVTVTISAANATLVDPPGGIAAVPEPGSLALIGLAGILLAVFLRKKRKPA